MTIQITRFSPHQTAKVFAIIMATSSLLFMIPFTIMSTFIPTQFDPNGNPINIGFPFAMIILMPILQGIMGYLFIRFGIWIYNKMYSKIGGIEFEFEAKN